MSIAVNFDLGKAVKLGEQENLDVLIYGGVTEILGNIWDKEDSLPF